MECLYNIIIKLKQKNYEIKMENIQFVHPIATSQINQLALKLVQKQNECDDFKKKCNELEVQVKDMKKEKLDEEYIRKQKCKEETEQKMIASENVERDTKRMADRIDELTKKCTNLERNEEQNGKVIAELENAVTIKEQKIAEHKQINDELRQKIVKLMTENKLLKNKEEELNNKLEVMQAVAGTVREEGTTDQLVVITNRESNDVTIYGP